MQTNHTDYSDSAAHVQLLHYETYSEASQKQYSNSNKKKASLEPIGCNETPVRSDERANAQ